MLTATWPEGSSGTPAPREDAALLHSSRRAAWSSTSTRAIPDGSLASKLNGTVPTPARCPTARPPSHRDLRLTGFDERHLRRVEISLDRMRAFPSACTCEPPRTWSHSTPKNRLLASRLLWTWGTWLLSTWQGCGSFEVSPAVAVGRRQVRLTDAGQRLPVDHKARQPAVAVGLEAAVVADAGDRHAGRAGQLPPGLVAVGYLGGRADQVFAVERAGVGDPGRVGADRRSAVAAQVAGRQRAGTWLTEVQPPALVLRAAGGDRVRPAGRLRRPSRRRRPAAGEPAKREDRAERERSQGHSLTVVRALIAVRPLKTPTTTRRGRRVRIVIVARLELAVRAWRVCVGEGDLAPCRACPSRRGGSSGSRGASRTDVTVTA